MRSTRNSLVHSLQQTASIVIAFSLLPIGSTHAKVSQETLESITTPDKIETSIGTLNFSDGPPLPETVQKVYDYLDLMRGVDAYIKGMPGASLYALIEGDHSQGTVEGSMLI